MCENGGSCGLIAENTYGCVCPEEFTGARCETFILGREIVSQMKILSSVHCLISQSSMCNNAHNFMSKWWCMYTEWS